MNQDIVGQFSESETKVTFVSGGHRHSISPFHAVNKEAKKSLGSHTFKVGPHLWQIVCYPGGETPEVREYVSLFLGYRGPDRDCCANWRLTLVNQIDAEKSRSRAWIKGDKFNKFQTGRRWGWQKFIKREDLLDPENGFIKDGTVIFEASLDVYLKLTTSLSSEDQFNFQLYPIPPSQLEADFSYFFEGIQGDPENMRGSGALADVEFVFDSGQSRLFAHSQILAARSQVFCNLFASAFSEARKGRRTSSGRHITTVTVFDIEYNVFLQVLSFVYTDDINWADVDAFLFKGNKKRSPVASQLLLSGENKIFKRRKEPFKKRKTNNIFSQSVDSPVSAIQIRPSTNATEVDGVDRPRSAGHVRMSSISSNDISDGSESDYELKHHADHRISETKRQMDLLLFTIKLYEAADKYELSRLRLIAEHKMVDILKQQIMRINRHVKEGLRYTPFQENSSITRLYGAPCDLGSPQKAHNRLLQIFTVDDSIEMKMNDELWCNGFCDVLSVADRHNSKRLKQLCYQALTSDALAKRTKRILLSNEMLFTLDRRVITEMLHYVTIREPKNVEEDEACLYEFSTLGVVPEGGKEAIDEREAEQLEVDGSEQKEASDMREAELKSELVERGFSVRGDRGTLVARLEVARALKTNGSLRIEHD